MESVNTINVAILKADIYHSADVDKDQLSKALSEFLKRFVEVHAYPLEPLYATSSAGDSVTVVDADAVKVADIATALRFTFISTNWRSRGFDYPISIRIGIRFGPISADIDFSLEDKADISGVTVVEATRIEESTTPGQIWCCQEFASVLQQRAQDHHYTAVNFSDTVTKVGKEGRPFFIHELKTAAEVSNGLDAFKQQGVAVSKSDHAFLQASSDIIGFIKESICLNQGVLLDYIFRLSSMHRDMRVDLLEHRLDQVLKKGIGKPISDLVDSSANLMDFTVDELRKQVNSNLYLLREYYEKIDGRHPVLPRICYKQPTNFEPGSALSDPECIELADVWRHVSDPKFSGYPIFKASDNSGFSQCIETGMRFLCNDIPDAAQKGILDGYGNRGELYRNTRLDPERVKDYVSSDELIDPSWIDCWELPGSIAQYSEEMARMCYKSTLIIPLTLRHNIDQGSGMSSEFRKKYHIPRGGIGTWGYVCLDHPTANYFTETDIQLGFIFADIISLYVLSNMNYTVVSDTYQEVSNMGITLS